MEKKQYNLSFYRSDTLALLECRQCCHQSEWQASFEASLYAAWAEYHYGCKVVYSVKEQ